MRRWSVVDLPSFPPACASVLFICFRARLLITLSYTFPTLLATVIPRSFEHIPFLPFPLYSLVIVPICHCWGVSCFLIMQLNIFLYILFVLLSAFVNISFGISSGQQLFPFFRFFV